MKGVCRVCELVQHDTSQKEVFWCDGCKAWICKDCNTNVPARMQAFGLTAIEKITNWFKN